MNPTPSMASPSPEPPSTRRLVVRLLLVVAAAFAFGWAMVPFYDVLCRVTGLNGKTPGFQAGGLAGAEAASRIDPTRTVTVEFTGTVMPGLPWDMRPLTASVDLHPGELQQVKYLVRNTSDHTIVGQAIPSVSPGQAAQYFHKLDCFCFRQQTLAPGESREMPLTFIVKPEIDRDIRQITLSYAFFNIEEPRREAR
ncbi:MAG TPA: cytochrome c oxidase assembly protein [Rhodocyclaceae bacterium]|nr:cytochrome c oxidase assembly protein [Rhodocyclaceae bacterium]